MRPRNPTANRWLSLGDASAILGVNESTLRQWADVGRIRTFRTPGGHRRFLRDDLATVLTEPKEPPRSTRIRTFGEATLRRIRRRLHGQNSTAPFWYERFDEERRARLRLFGRRLLEVTAASLGQRKRPDLLAEVRLIGQEHGRELARSGFSLPEVVEVFLFFRNTLQESLLETVKERNAGISSLPAWRHVDWIIDELLRALADAYERSRHDSSRPSYQPQEASG